MRAVKPRLTIVAGILACCVVFAAEPARADLITTFDIAGEIGLPGPVPVYPVSGTITIDTTLGVVVAQTIVSGSPQLTQGNFAPGQSYFVEIILPLPGPPDPSCLGCYPIADDLIYFNTASLVGYAGGALGSVATPSAGGTGIGISYFSSYSVGFPLLAGTATPEAIPEPGSIVLLAIGVALVTLAARRRTS